MGVVICLIVAVVAWINSLFFVFWGDAIAKNNRRSSDASVDKRLYALDVRPLAGLMAWIWPIETILVLWWLGLNAILPCAGLLVALIALRLSLEWEHHHKVYWTAITVSSVSQAVIGFVMWDSGYVLPSFLNGVLITVPLISYLNVRERPKQYVKVERF